MNLDHKKLEAVLAGLIVDTPRFSNSCTSVAIGELAKRVVVLTVMTQTYHDENEDYTFNPAHICVSDVQTEEIPRQKFGRITRENGFVEIPLTPNVVPASVALDLSAALSMVLDMEVKGHSLRDRLQFNDQGREILNFCENALREAAK
jgi:hypothetical protein